MTDASDAIGLALAEVDRLRKLLIKGKATQVRSLDEKSAAKATSLAWFRNHRAELGALSSLQAFESADASYRELLEASERSCTRSVYGRLLKELRRTLIFLRSEAVVTNPERAPSSDSPPSFVPLVLNEKMQEILAMRWAECVSCLNAGAPLSATVMMGGLLEGMLLARINHEPSKASIFKAKSAPKDSHGKTMPLSEWTLKAYIDVSHELGWITVSAKEIGQVLRDYRNYIHPFKQLSHGVVLEMADAALLWEVSKAVTRQVIRSAT